MSRQNSQGGRKARLEAQIQQIVALELMNNSKDRDLQHITITAVELTGDLHDAKVYFSVVGNEVREMLAEKALNRSKGRMRTVLAHSLHTRIAPSLQFKLDNLQERAEDINNLLDKVAVADAALQKKRENAGLTNDFPNGQSPYKEPKSRPNRFLEEQQT